MNQEAEVKKLEKIFSSDGRLRSLIPQMIENKLYYDRLRNLEGNWMAFKDALLGIGIRMGDILEIYQLVQTVPREEIEQCLTKNKKMKEDDSDKGIVLFFT